MIQKKRRFRLIADPNIQGLLCLRFVIYWIACQVAVIGTVCGTLALGNNETPGGPPWRIFLPAIYVSFFVMPIVLLDLLAFSNRVVGPIVNMRRVLGDLSTGNPGSEVRLRQGDYLQDMADSVNRIRLVVENSSECGKPRETENVGGWESGQHQLEVGGIASTAN